jgi:hypothetical protein
VRSIGDPVRLYKAGNSEIFTEVVLSQVVWGNKNSASVLFLTRANQDVGQLIVIVKIQAIILIVDMACLDTQGRSNGHHTCIFYMGSAFIISRSI